MKDVNKMYALVKTEDYSPRNRVPIQETKFLNISTVFTNYKSLAERHNRQNPQKKLYQPRQSFIDFWVNIDKHFLQTLGQTFFEWFDELYFQNQLSLKDVCLRFNKIIFPESRDIRSFHLFINFYAFIDTRDRAESLNTPIAKIRLYKRTRHSFTEEERKKGVQTKKEVPGYTSLITKKGWEKLSPEKRRARGLKSVETRQKNQIIFRLIQTIQKLKILKVLESK